MQARTPHPSTKQATIEHIDGGWISYVDPSRYPKARFGETKPYYAPETLDSLRGPDSGIIKLPQSVYWGPDRLFNLSHWSALREVYQMVLQEGSVEDINDYLNRDVLLSIWSDLSLPPRVAHLWDQKVIGASND